MGELPKTGLQKLFLLKTEQPVALSPSALVKLHLSGGLRGCRDPGDPGASNAALVILVHNLVCSHELKDAERGSHFHGRPSARAEMEKMLNLFFFDGMGFSSL